MPMTPPLVTPDAGTFCNHERVPKEITWDDVRSAFERLNKLGIPRPDPPPWMALHLPIKPVPFE